MLNNECSLPRESLHKKIVNQFLTSRYLKNIKEWKLIIMLSVYVGFFLNAPIFLRKLQAQSTTDIPILLCDMLLTILFSACLLSIFTLFGARIFKFLAATLIIISSIAAYYMWYFNIVVGYGIIQAVFGTEAALSLESVDYRCFLFVLIFGVLPATWITVLSLKIEPAIIKRYVYRICLILFLVYSMKGINHYFYDEFQKQLVDGRAQTNPIGVAAHSYVPSNWLAGSILAVGNFLVNEKLKKSWKDPLEQFSFIPQVDLNGTYLVVVIGESARYDHMGMMGYERDTTPLLSKKQNVIGFKAESCNTSTKLSLACMFVREGGVIDKGQPPQQFVYENHLFYVLKKLGFSIDLFAMQSEAEFYSTIGADMFKIREEIGAEVSQHNKPVIDDMLLVDQAVRSINAHPNGKHVVILHQKGSHFLYSSRYPQEFAKYIPECKAMNCNLEQLINAYDNTILYTDYFLSSLIDSLSDKKVLLVYASDHGESISEGEHFHGTSKDIAPPEQRRVPIILWASEAYLSVNGLHKGFELARQKSKNQQKIVHTDIFESVLGCMGFTSNDGGIRLKNNWCG